MASRPAAPDARFAEYFDRLADAVGHADRREPLRAYLTGLLLPGSRKSVEPMAARLDPAHVAARHQSMHHFVASAPWDGRAVLAAARDHALGALERHGPVCAWVVDDTGVAKKGTHSVGVARQYLGVLGKTDNCQVFVSLSLANRTMSVPCAWRLYLPKAWAEDRARRKEAGVPPDVEFHTKWEIALEEIQALVAEDVPRAPVVADAGYGDNTEFRDRITALDLAYAVGVKLETTVWPPAKGPLGPKAWSGRGRPPTLLRRGRGHHPSSIEALARDLPASSWKRVRWREGTRGTMESRFARLRVRPAHRDEQREEPRPEEWLLIEWPREAEGPTKAWLSTVTEDASLEEMVDLVKIRWRIERDYEEMKQELGLGHYEGRGWLGVHHHGVLSMAAYGFLSAERARLSPPEPLAFLKPARLPKGFRPRGAPVQT